MASTAGSPISPAALGGRLTWLIGERDSAALAHEVSAVSLEPRPDSGRPRYEDVLAWVMESIVEVVEARLGAAPPGETFLLEVRRTDGGAVTAAELPASGEWVLRTAAAFLADDPAAGRHQLAVAARQLEPLRRAETLTDALIWLDFLLDVDLPDPPDVPTR
ncbi:hypothetical protein ACFTWF_03675 [Rhodococcus sp. NPDC056960]|uniref:hypothetical protein n=1 Tax=Rhodococcus sp. NPDC056960 TaxID=3345982 RepID=UPI0036426420